MIQNVPSSSGNGTFSANVRLSLYFGDQRFDVASLGPSFAILREQQSFPSTNAEIESIVDGKVTRWPIRITTPLDGTAKRFEFVGADDK